MREGFVREGFVRTFVRIAPSLAAGNPDSDQ